MQKILLLGKGISNNALDQFMKKYNINHDYYALNEVNNYDYNLIIKGPGIYYQEEVIQEFIRKQKTIITDIEFIYWFLTKDYIAITGTVGKTTTLALIDKILSTTYKVVSCGNNGYPFAQAALDYKNYQFYLLELSSFQLKGTINFTPKIAVILNLSLHHLDYHETFNDYINAKYNITKNQTKDDILIYNDDDLEVQQIATKSQAKKVSFSLTNKRCDAYLSGNTFYYQKEAILKLKNCLIPLKYNILAAICVAKAVGLSNLKIKQAIMHFKPLKDRLEYLGNKIYNDAKSTSILATIGAISSLKRCKLCLICGGYDRNDDISMLDDYLTNLQMVLIYGAVKEKLKRYFQSKQVVCFTFNTLEEATLFALANRKKLWLLYSPMHASYDQYQNYQERGKEFRGIIKSYYQK